MAWTPYQLYLAFLMLTTGSINTLSTKWADETKAAGRDGIVRKFDHPFLQASSMFMGEFLCFLLFKALYFYYKKQGVQDERELTKGNRNFNPFILFIPAMCDMIATSTTYVGLNLTYASSFQMLRGSVIIFVGVLSVAFLQRTLRRREWSGMFLIIIGLTTIGVADFVYTSHDDSFDRNGIITGDLLIVAAQIITATQMVVEERFVAGLDIPPLQAVGWEGIFGFCVLALLQIPMYYVRVSEPFGNNSRGVVEDAIEAFVQMGNNFEIVVATMGTVISIAFFNFAGISVTKELSATTRMVLDSLRTIIIWIFSLTFWGQQFLWLQMFGFVVLFGGMCLYNGITFRYVFIRVRHLFMSCTRRRDDEESIINTPAHETVEAEA